MSIRASHRRLFRAALVVGAGACAASLVAGTAPASAADPSPVVTYIDAASAGADTRWLSSAAPDGSSAIHLTPSNYQTEKPVAGLAGRRTTPLGVGTGSATTVDLDRTWALVLVHRSGGTTTSHVLSTTWDTWPALSADGSTAWWMSDGKVFKYTAGTTTVAAPSLFAPRAGERAYRLVVTPDGTVGAVEYSNSAGGARIFAASFTAGRNAPYFESTSFCTQTPPSGFTFVFSSPTTLVFGLESVSTGAILNGIGTLAAGNGTWKLPPARGLLRREPARRRLVAVQGLGVDHVVRTTTDLTSTGMALTPRSNGSTTFDYRPSTVLPPAATAADNLAHAYPYLYLSTSATTYGVKASYQSYALYLTPVPGQTFDNDAYETDAGILQYSLNGGSTWTNLTLTTAAKPVAWPGTTALLGNGTTQVLTRNTWFRWQYPGTDFTAPSTSVVRAVTVAPLVKVRERSAAAPRPCPAPRPAWAGPRGWRSCRHQVQRGRPGHAGLQGRVQLRRAGPGARHLQGRHDCGRVMGLRLGDVQDLTRADVVADEGDRMKASGLRIAGCSAPSWSSGREPAQPAWWPARRRPRPPTPRQSSRTWTSRRRARTRGRWRRPPPTGRRRSG